MTPDLLMAFLQISKNESNRVFFMGGQKCPLREDLTMTKRRTRRMTIWLALGAVIICALVVRVMIYARLPNITKEGTIPIMLVANGKVFLAAWQPEAVTLDVGTRKPIGTLSAHFYEACFAQIGHTGSLVWRGGAEGSEVNNPTESSTGLTSWTHYVLTPITTLTRDAVTPLSSAVWWSGRGVDLTTASIPGETTATSPLVEAPRQLVVTDSANRTLSVDLPHTPAGAGILDARGDLQDGFILLQWQAQGESFEQAEHLLLVRLQNGNASTHDVARDSNFKPKDFSTWLGKVSGDRFDCYACVGEQLYVMPGKMPDFSQHVWTLDLDAANPVVRLDKTLTDFANSTPSAVPNTGFSLLQLTASGPYLLFVTPTGVKVIPNAWAVRDGKVVGHLSVKNGVLQASAGDLSASRSIKGLGEMLLPFQHAFSPFFWY
jgi:hypothetical protein